MKTLRKWVKELLIQGKPCFSLNDVRMAFPNLLESSMRRELTRLVAEKVIVNVYRGFYVVVPPHYALDLKIPTYFYIDQLMRYLNKPYYLSLLTAGLLSGAAHQRPQRTFVTTIPPRSRTTVTKNDDLFWVFRPQIPEKFLQRKNSETGTLLYSTSELTAIDLVQYEQHIGGLSRSATILAELVEKIDFSNSFSSGLLAFATVPTIQRLGFLLDEILDEKQHASILYNQLSLFSPTFTYQFLSHRCSAIKDTVNKRWKIYVNTKIESDIW